jgi:hypothetical protein
VRDALAHGTGRLCWSVTEYANVHDDGLDIEHSVLDSNIRTLAPVSGRFHVGNTRAYFPGNNGFFISHCDEAIACDTTCARVAAAGVGLLDWADFDGLADKAQLRELRREEDPKTVLFDDPRARPYASLPAVKHVPAEQLADLVFAKGRDVNAATYLAGTGADDPAPGGTLTVTRPQPNQIIAEAQLDHPGLAMVAESCERGWRARVDGQPAPLLKGDGMFCALALPAGAHHLELEYRPFGWPWAFLGPLAFAAIAFASWRRQGQRSSSRGASGGR